MSIEGTITLQGFEDLSRGTCGNGGHNLYVSRAGVLQRIHQFDITGNGHTDLLFCNSQEHWERPPVYVYTDPLTNAPPDELPADGAWAGAVADLTGDGRDDLIVGMHSNGIREDLNAYVYFGSPQGWSERATLRLPVPVCTAVAAGDFNGDSRTDLCFVSRATLRLFFQTDLLFEPTRYTELDIAAEQIAATDLDGDGYADLIVRTPEGEMWVYPGSPRGIDPATGVLCPYQAEIAQAMGGPETRYAEHIPDAAPQISILSLNGAWWFLIPRGEEALLLTWSGGAFGDPLCLPAHNVMAAASGDITGRGETDIVLACRDRHDGGERSWVYWGNGGEYSLDHRTPLPTRRACGVAVCDLSGNGCGDVAFSQSHTDRDYTSDSLVYAASPAGLAGEPLALTTHDARAVLAARPSGDDPANLVFINARARNMVGDVSPVIYEGGPEGFDPQHRIALPGWDTVESVCCDLTDTGEVDVVLANCSENSVWLDPGSFIYHAGAEGLPAAPSLALPTVRAHGVCCADLDRDGYLDLVFCGFDNPDLTVFHGTPEGFDTEHPDVIHMEHEGEVFSEPRWIYLVDLNNDGWLDLVVPQIASTRSFVLWGGPGGFSMSNASFLSVWHAACARAVDLNGNGYPDLIMGGHTQSLQGPHDSFVSIYHNGPGGLQESRKTMLPSWAVNAMAVADFNNDGLMDLFVCSYHDGRERDIPSRIYWNRRGRGFSERDFTPLQTHSASGCMAGDFNHDGWVDLAVANHKVEGDHVGWSAVWWNSPEGFDPGRVTVLPTSGPHGMRAVEPGNILDRGDEEYYLSPVIELPAGAGVDRVRWEADLPSGSWVTASIRVATEGEEIADGEWLAGDEPLPNPPSGARYVQVRLALGARDSGRTPRVRSISVDYR